MAAIRLLMRRLRELLRLKYEAGLRQQTFSTFADLNAAIRTCLDAINDRPMKIVGVCSSTPTGTSFVPSASRRSPAC